MRQELPEPRVDAALASGEAPEDEALDQDEARVARHLDLKPPFERGALKDKRLLRQPEEARLRRKRKAGFDMGGRAVAAVDLFRSRCGRLDRGALSQLKLDAIGVAARDPAAGVDQHRFASAR